MKASFPSSFCIACFIKLLCSFLQPMSAHRALLSNLSTLENWVVGSLLSPRFCPLGAERLNSSKGQTRVKLQRCPAGRLPHLTTNPLNVEVFVIASVIAKQCLDGGISLNVDQFLASGTNFSLYNDQQTADHWVSKWPPAVENGSPLC